MVESTLFENAPLLFEQLPQILLLADIAFYGFGALFFGSLAMKGFRGDAPFLVHFSIRVSLGLLSMMGGIALRGFFVFARQGIFPLFTIDIVLGSLASAMLLGIGLFLLSFRLVNVSLLKKQIAHIEKRIHDAKKVPKEKRGMRDPLKIAGVAVIGAVMIFSIATFGGFIRPSDEFYSFVGLEPEDFSAISEQLKNINAEEQGCRNVITIVQEVGSSYDTLPVSHERTIQGLIEQNAGSFVSDMRITPAGDILAVTQDAQFCTATPTAFCGCIDTKEILATA